MTRMAWLEGLKQGHTMCAAILAAWGQMLGIWMWASQVVATSRKLMIENAVVASAAPQLPDVFSPFAADRFEAEAVFHQSITWSLLSSLHDRHQHN